MKLCTHRWYRNRRRLAVALVTGLLPTAHARASLLFDDISAYQSGTPNASATFTASTPNTFTGDVYVLSTGATDITGLDVFPVDHAGANYTSLEVSVYIWGSVNTGTVSSSSPAFSNLLGSGGLYVPGSYQSGFTYPIQGSPTGATPGISFNTPVQLNGISTVGVTISFEGSSNGSSYQLANSLTSLITYGVPATTGSESFNGYYRNANSETNGNFTSALRNLGFANQSLALRIYGDVAIPPAVWTANSNGDWATSSNWSAATVPTSTSNAVFNSSSSYAVTISSSDVCKNLNVQLGNPTIDLSAIGSALNISGALSVGQPSSGSGQATVALTHSFGGTAVNISAGSIAVGANGGRGTLTIGSGIRLVSANAVSIAAGSSVVILHGGKLVAPAVNIAETTNTWSGLLDIGSSALDLSSESIVDAFSQVRQGYILSNTGNRNGSGGIYSSMATNDTTHLTAVGVMINNDGAGTALYGSGGSLGAFGTSSPGLNDVLIRPTFFGDANLDGKVDGSDYSRIDNGVMNGLTGWYNGDFNYDGSIDGSDYTLIDNAFNTQDALMIADPTAQTTSFLARSLSPTTASIGSLQTAGVPEPTNLIPLLSLSLFSRTSRFFPRLRRAGM